MKPGTQEDPPGSALTDGVFGREGWRYTESSLGEGRAGEGFRSTSSNTGFGEDGDGSWAQHALINPEKLPNLGASSQLYPDPEYRKDLIKKNHTEILA